jgi:hypothetical protein
MKMLPRLFAARATAPDRGADRVSAGSETQGRRGEGRCTRQGQGPVPPSYLDVVLKQRVSQGSRTRRAARRDPRRTEHARELLVRAKKQGLDKTPGMKAEMDLTAQTVLVRTYWPIT